MSILSNIVKPSHKFESMVCSLSKKTPFKNIWRGKHTKKVNKLEQKRQLGAVGFKEKVVKDTPIGRGHTKTREKDLETLKICFNSAYYLVKQECPFSDCPNLITLIICI